MFTARRTALLSPRLYSTAPLKKSLKELVAELRNKTDVSPTQAGQALKASSMDVPAALLWLEKNRAESAVKKVAKVEGRTTNEGLVGTAVLSGGSSSSISGVRAAMVELNCETDFVARNELFGKLLEDIAHTAAFISEPVDSETIMQSFSLDVLQNAPLLSHSSPEQGGKTSVLNAMRDLTGRVGEKISLRRVMTVVRDQFPPSQRDLALRVTSRVHQSVHSPKQGRIGCLALLALRSPRLSELLASRVFQDDFDKLCQALGRQIIGFPTTMVRAADGTQDESALYEQPFSMYIGQGNEQPVQKFLQSWALERGLMTEGADYAGGVEVLEFAKWTVGESL
ncbi:Elongation factor Ts, mitochondrial 2 [Taiwanofungus camphoratus]|nr:Elongation factor Ts, mitochondrial 2 [Antrodia cinnamomea]KAI0931568.1 Elongation factor Ts, mitochondrial 2, variant 2 [Antrodia cinnamomea]KAI0936963.1 Elongation factor Ts, mitochondrial 2 [Antrodia cinnamomea]KAI0962184.1 Elongation factor Ts, mitochondrial 2 [Antrodia cinnamomea]KAI0964185.1 Elongation factor Ts, mitochondrial 2 [Antrodia cinnamomea]